MASSETPSRKLRCAIYTRKSTEEGLEQNFNSLDAQREACRAYIRSQQHEGWTLDDTPYDDGGYSGGTMERPALQQLLGEVRDKRIDIVLVYKIDRLTRSLTDFARIVEVMDEAGASFVSVTQSFNTTSSMGRLTLNMLLSFAQYERELTGERIRDKVAASKKKGMWMGGPVPLGYRVEERKLLIDETEAEQIRTIFSRYLEAGSVRALVPVIADLGIRSKIRHYKTGKRVGGCIIRPDGLHHILRNPIYRGQIAHKGDVYAGEHDAIIDERLWSAVQARLDDQAANPAVRTKHPSLLAGLVFDGFGRRLTPSHATRGSQRYRYYCTPADAPREADKPPIRIPAHDLEAAVLDCLQRLLTDRNALAAHYAIHDIEAIGVGAKALAEDLDDPSPAARQRSLRVIVDRITVETSRVVIALRGDGALGSIEGAGEIELPAVKIRSGRNTSLVVSGDYGEADVEPSLLKLVTEAFDVRERLGNGQSLGAIAEERGSSRKWTSRLAMLGWLAPVIVERIADGTQPAELTRRRLSTASKWPLAWDAQVRRVEALADQGGEG